MANATKRIKHPYYVKQLYASWRLRVLKHEHTGKRVHHQHTSYPMLAFLLLLVGLVLAQSTYTTFAASKTISAVVSGPVPIRAATIETPAEGSTLTFAPVMVSGSCPKDTYIQLFRNNFPSGTAFCSTAGTYQIETALFAGTNALIVRDYNLVGEAGPDSATRMVTYAPPLEPQTPPVEGSMQATPDSSGTSPSTVPATVQPLVLRNDYLFQGFYVGEPASWKVAVSGGAAPYSIHVDWGDGSSDLFASATADTLTLNHSYTKQGPQNGSYAIVITASDSAGAQTVLQIVALVAGDQAGVSALAQGSNGGGQVQATVFGVPVTQAVGSAWVAFSSVSVSVLGFWLGELHGLRRLGIIPKLFKH